MGTLKLNLKFIHQQRTQGCAAPGLVESDPVGAMLAEIGETHARVFGEGIDHLATQPTSVSFLQRKLRGERERERERLVSVRAELMGCGRCCWKAWQVVFTHRQVPVVEGDQRLDLIRFQLGDERQVPRICTRARARERKISSYI